jgi:hypothetical protein
LNAATRQRQRGPSESPGKDLAAAIVIGLIALGASLEALTFESPDQVLTAPGMPPFLTGVSLLIMSLVLGIRAVRAGGAAEPVARLKRTWASAAADTETRRTFLVAFIVTAYIVLVGMINFELRVETPWLDLAITSYEIVSIAVTTLMLRLFWKGPRLQCFVISALTVLAIASIFRYAFAIIMPQTT